MDCRRSKNVDFNSTLIGRLIRKLKDFVNSNSGNSNLINRSPPTKSHKMRNNNNNNGGFATLQQQRNNVDDGTGLALEPLGQHHRSTSVYSLSEQIDFLNSTSSMDEDDDVINCSALAKCIESTLRESKSSSQSGLECGEVLVPTDLTTRVAESVLQMSEEEPCGIRGCVIFIVYEDTANKICRRVGKVRCDPNSVVTFEVTLTLRPDNTGWLLRLLPLKICWTKLRNVGGGSSSSSSSSLVVSSAFALAKNKLYRSSCEPAVNAF